MIKHISLTFLFFFLYSCVKSPNEYSKNVDINTKGVLTPISFSIDGKEISNQIDLDEFDTTEDRSLIILVKVKNNTDYPLTDLDVLFINQVSNVWGFERGEEGGQGTFPGASGTCARTVMPHKSCQIAIAFNTSLSGDYNQLVEFKYKNLIEGSGKSTTLSIYAGVPASLIYFEDAQTQFAFGQKVGLAGKYFVERTEKITFHKKLIVMNKGELRARTVIPNLSHSCESEETLFCPSGMDETGESWSYTTNCPSEIRAGFECEVDIYFTPQNQDPLIGVVPTEIESIKYSSIMRFDYKNDPSLTPAALNGYFSQISQKIEARFGTTIEAQAIEGEIIVGNRSSTMFKVNNTGSREGVIKAIVAYDNASSAHLATCIATDEIPNDYLRCYNEDLSAELTLEEFPFFFKDRDNCLVSDGESIKYTDVDYGCVFEAYFQPSIEYKTAKDFNLRLDVNYDSRWKGLETIVQRKMHTLDAYSLAASKLVVSKMMFDGREVIPTEEYVETSPNANYHLGRLALLSPNYIERVSLRIEFYNEGGVPVSILNFKDGSDRVIPFSEDNPAGTNLGFLSPYYFTGTYVLSSECANIPPGGKCAIQTSFAPVAMATTAEETSNMFDIVAADVLDSVKKFMVSYEDSALYTDENRYTTVKDIPRREAEANIKAVLVKKGYLADYDKNYSANLGQVVAGNKAKRVLVLRNIGSGDISYLPYTGEKSINFPQKGVKYIPTANPASYGAEYDCLDILDFDYTVGEDSTDVLARKNVSWRSLPKDEACVLSVEWQKNNYMYSNTDSDIGIPTSHVLSRPYTSSFAGLTEQWPFSSKNNQSTIRFCVNYYDGDVTNPDLSSDFDTTFGSPTACDGETSYISGLNFQANPLSPVDIFPISPRPVTSAILYRPSYTLPDIFIDGNLHKASETVPEIWAYDRKSINVFDPVIVPFAPSYYSWSEVQSEIRAYSAGKEAVIHYGTMPAGTTQNLSFTLVRKSIAASSLINEELTGDAAFSFSSYVPAVSSTSGTHKNILASTISSTSSSHSGLSVPIRIQASAPGLYTASYKYTYTNGIFLNGESGARKEITKEIVLIVRVIDDAPNILASVQDFDLELSSDEAPVETLNPTSTNLSMSYNEASINTPLLFSTVKIDERSVEASYIKKRVTLENTSLSSGLYNLQFLLRSAPTDIVSATYNINSIKLDYNNCNAALGRTRALGQASFGTSGSPTDSCYIDIWYQPVNSDSSATFYLSMAYELTENQWVHKNIRLDFEAKEPAIVFAVGKSLKPISDETGNTRMSYPLPFGTVELKENYQELAFNQTSGSMRKVVLKNNNESTRASFLKSYHEYLTEYNVHGYSDANRPPVDFYPPGGDYVLVNGEFFTTIYQSTYSNGTPRVRVEATEPCFNGDNESGLLSYQKGFYETTTLNCTMNFYLYADLNYMNKNLDPSKADDMDGNYVTLNYYNNDRSSVSFITFHFEGKVTPNRSFKVGEDYLNVISAESRLIRFEWQPMIPDAPELGAIVGYRVFQSIAAFSLDDPLTYTGEYFDVTTPYFEVSSGLVRRNFYFYKVVPIREDSRYNANAFPGLGAGRYLSVSDIKTLQVVVPPTNHYFDYNLGVLISKDYIGPFQLYSESLGTCSSQNKLNLTNAGSASPYTYRLIDNDVWDVISSNPTQTTNYTNLFEMSHWVQTSGNRPDTYFAGVPQYIPSESTQNFDINGQTYYYNEGSNCENCVMNMVRGGLGDYQDIIGLMAPDIPLGVARCYIQLPPN